MAVKPSSGEKRLLQLAIAIAALVPLAAGGVGMLAGVSNVPGIDPAFRINLDSHFRYLSALLFGAGLGFLFCLPRIEQRSLPFRLLGLMVVIGGLARLASLLAIGAPGGAHLFALGMELGVVPALLLWQWRVARKQRATAGPG